MFAFVYFCNVLGDIVLVEIFLLRSVVRGILVLGRKSKRLRSTAGTV